MGSFRKTLVSFIFLAISSIASAFIDRDVHMLNMQNGLSNNIITTICKDNDGFVWFGTGAGLSRFDGRNVSNFASENSYPNISDLTVIDNNTLGFIENGVFRSFDICHEKFHSVLVDQMPIIINSFVVLDESTVLVALNDSLLKLELSAADDVLSGRITGRYTYDSEAGVSFVNLSFDRESNSVCIVDNRCNIIIINSITMKETKRINLGLKERTRINSLLYDNDIAWISTTASGIYYCHIPSGRVERLTYSQNNEECRLTHTDSYGVCKFGKNRYVAVTWDGYTTITVSEERPGIVSTELNLNSTTMKYRNIETRMISVYFDPSGILWIGTDGGGVIWSDLRMQFYKCYYQDTHNEICSIVSDREGYIWLATFHKGLLRSDFPATNNQDLSFSPVPTGLPHHNSTFLCALRDSSDNLWFGTKRGTLVKYDADIHSFKEIPVGTELFSNESEIWSLLFDSIGRLWIGTQRGVWVFNTVSLQSEKLSFNSNEQLSSACVRAMTQSKDGTIWLGTEDYGLLRVVNDNIVISDYEKNAGLTANSVRSIMEASDGTIYVGYMTGVATISPEKRNITSFFSSKDGLCGDFVGCICEDSKGHIWLGTNSGISRYSRHRKIFYNYYISGSNRSTWVLNDLLYWGNNKNLVYFNPSDINTYDNPDRVAITHLNVNNHKVGIGQKENGKVILSQSVSKTKLIDLSYANRNFSLEFDNLSYSSNPQKFSYRLRPYQNEWILSSGENQVSYANLDSGHYIFEVKSILPDESEGGITSLEVVIHPHWTNTSLFKIAVAVLFAVIGQIIVQYIKRKRNLREQEIQLEHEVFTANMERDKERQIRLERENFFTSAAHELRTPLTLIISPLQELIHHYKTNDETFDRLNQIYSSSISLNKLVDNILYVQKIESKMVSLSVSYADLNEICFNEAVKFKELAVNSQISYEIAMSREPMMAYVDSSKIASAINNLLSNAFKYTQEGGFIRIAIDRQSLSSDSYFRITVSDTGAGIPDKIKNHIFESFTTGTSSPRVSSKSGIGLRIVKNTVDLHHGIITLDSEESEGTTFTVLIPEGTEHFSKEELKMYGLYEADKSTGEASDTGTDFDYQNESNLRKMLIIEDNVDIRQFIKSLFSDKFSIKEAGDGIEGYDAAISFQPDIIIIDIMMPKKDGFECLSDIRNNTSTSHIPVVMLTAKAEDMDIVRATADGADDYIIKPFNPAVLKSKIYNIIAQRERLKRIYANTFPSNKVFDDSIDNDDFLQQVILCIERNMADEDFGVQKLSNQLCMSQATLYRKLKQHCSLNAIDLIRRVRMVNAASLIAENRYSLQEIAEKVGYADTRTLRKHFVSQFGVQPSKYMTNS